MAMDDDFQTKPEMYNKTSVVEMLYESLKHGDTETVAKLLAIDLEWWFHGPPRCQHMMRMLTGESIDLEFNFEPRNITAIDDRVIVEGWEGDEAYWVHVWTLKDGLITQFREYFNTWLTVRDLRMNSVWEVKAEERPTIWQSEPREHLNRSLPGLVLAI
ncbi:Wound-induced protein [Macleaya cordata]|uniref:Wound-induced protein n=1 Tax=Macleaya cordata TaxID=56857 RepID=A0A200R3D3_MACCD|nr:Wound-induced protein [Macleaya cordata]